MALVKRNYYPAKFERVNPFAPMFNEFFEGMFNTPELTEGTFQMPAINVSENSNGFAIELAAPGLQKEDFSIDLERNTLTVSVSKESEEKEEGKNYHRREFRFSSFKRAFNLPETVDTEKITADYKEGVLKLNVPKKEEALLKAKQIKVA